MSPDLRLGGDYSSANLKTMVLPSAQRSVLAVALTYVVVSFWWYVDGQSWFVAEPFSSATKAMVFLLPGALVSVHLDRASPRQYFIGLGLATSPLRGAVFGLLSTLPLFLAPPLAHGLVGT